MSDGVRVWSVDESDSLMEMEPSKLDYEERIENWICNNVSVLVPDDSALMVIGRQVKTSSGGRIDLLCMNGDGDLVIVELKRDKTPREITAQALDYASWVQGLSAQQVEEIAVEYLKGKPLEEAFETTFRDRERDYPEVINAQHSIKIVASLIDDSTERIIRYLSGKGIAINFVRFHLFKSAEGREHLVRTFVIPPEQAEENSPGTKRTMRHKTLQDRLNDESTDEAEREFLKERLSDPKQELNRSKNALYYRVSGTVRFKVPARISHAYVIQIGRFANDETIWREQLSTHKVGLRRNATALGFSLKTREDYKFFQDTMEHKIAGFHWTLAEADGDDGEENEDEEH
ncbi:MAG: hypothetical protein ACLQOO_03090 [Terriglobia bacterium]